MVERFFCRVIISGVHHLLDLGHGLDHGTDWSMAFLKVSFSCSAASNVDDLSAHASSFRACSRKFFANSSQLVFRCIRLGVNVGGEKTQFVVVGAWSELPPPPLSQDHPRIRFVTCPLAKDKSTMLGLDPFLGKWVKVPGMFKRLKL